MCTRDLRRSEDVCRCVSGHIHHDCCASPSHYKKMYPSGLFQMVSPVCTQYRDYLNVNCSRKPASTGTQTAPKPRYPRKQGWYLTKQRSLHDTWLNSETIPTYATVKQTYVGQMERSRKCWRETRNRQKKKRWSERETKRDKFLRVRYFVFISCSDCVSYLCHNTSHSMHPPGEQQTLWGLLEQVHWVWHVTRACPCVLCATSAREHALVTHHRNIRDDCQTLWHCSEPTAATVLTTTVPSTDARSTGWDLQSVGVWLTHTYSDGDSFYFTHTSIFFPLYSQTRGEWWGKTSTTIGGGGRTTQD